MPCFSVMYQDHTDITIIIGENGYNTDSIIIFSSWKEKVGLCNSHREQAWLYHEIGYCYLSKMDYFSAKQYGALSMETAQTIVDSKWELNATILTGQAECMIDTHMFV